MEKKDILSIFVQLLLGLQHIHSKNIIHRDLKPENIMITKDNRAKILDLGCGFKLEKDRDMDNCKIGTLYYMAPELTEKKDYGTKVDVWSAGVILYELCTGLDYYENKNG